MAKNQNNKTDWVSILEVLVFVCSAAIEVVKKWQEKEYVEDIQSETKRKETKTVSDNE